MILTTGFTFCSCPYKKLVVIVIAINDLKMTAAAVEILLQIKSFLFIFLIFHLLARKGLESLKVETYLSYIDLELAKMELTLKDYIIELILLKLK